MVKTDMKNKPQPQWHNVINNIVTAVFVGSITYVYCNYQSTLTQHTDSVSPITNAFFPHMVVWTLCLAYFFGFFGNFFVDTETIAQAPSTVDIATELRLLTKRIVKQDKKLLMIAKEVVIQHRNRLDVWTPSKRSKQEQKDFKDNLISYYQRHHNTSTVPDVKCMILDAFFPRECVIASHIWKWSTYGRGLDEFGLNQSDVNSCRNGFLICEKIEKAFDEKRVCFLVNKMISTNIYVKVLDPTLIDPNTSELVLPQYSTVKFSDIDGLPLQHPAGCVPFRRILDFHAKLSYRDAIARGWLLPNSSFDDFFDMSIDASIPDIGDYQNEDDDGVDGDD